MSADMKQWLAIIVRGTTLTNPSHIKVRQHRKWVLISAEFSPDEEGGDIPVIDIALENCPRMRFTPDTKIHTMDFEGEWPPYQIMKELERPRLVATNGEIIKK